MVLREVVLQLGSHGGTTKDQALCISGKLQAPRMMQKMQNSDSRRIDRPTVGVCRPSWSALQPIEPIVCFVFDQTHCALYLGCFL